MMTAVAIDNVSSNSFPVLPEKERYAVQSTDVEVLSGIHRDDVNIAIWQREITPTLQQSVKELLATCAELQLELRTTPQTAFSKIHAALGNISTVQTAELSHDIAGLVNHFCRICGLQRVEVRLTTLSSAMCPKFHADYVPCRLLTTYHGVATEWLPHQSMDRSKLGAGSNGLPDEKSGLFGSSTDIQHLHCGDVALLKGDLWQGNKDAGLVHRSPLLADGESRLLLRLDYC